jgi:DMSO/TMAO reductase YedYZ molybdopterin-dependent catalytic subunit
VERPASFSLAELEGLPPAEVVATMECAGNGRARLDPRPISQPWLVEAVGTARWSGVALADVLELVRPAADAVSVVFAGLDRGLEGGVEQRYERALPLGEARSSGAVLATHMNGVPLPPQHGFPLRLVVPGWYGMTNVKWLGELRLETQPFAGYQHQTSYRVRLHDDDEGEPVTRMLPRALLVPPGIPDFLTRVRTLPLGAVTLRGRAWSGLAPIEGVTVSADGGSTWLDAELGDDLPGPWAWRPWSLVWEPPRPGRYELLPRARDAAGSEQPLEPPWNVGGYANNAVQRVVVDVV